ncbi:MFS general substrate transporter, partial [Mycena maculata]
AYLNDPRYSKQAHASSVLPFIGPVATGVMNSSGKNTEHRRKALWIGLILCWASLFSVSYISTGYAIGGTLLYAPCISYLSEWFVTRPGFANSVIFAGTAVGVIVLPPLLPRLISAFGVAKALRYISIGIALVCAPCPFVKPRIPLSRTTSISSPPPPKSGMDGRQIVLDRHRHQGFAYYLPVVWLPTFANDMNISVNQSSLAIALLNGSSLVGRLFLGYLSDKANPWTLEMCTLLPFSLVTFFVWGFSRNLASIIGFGIAYGCPAGSWTSLWSGFIKPVAKDDPNLATYLFGYLTLSRGFGNIMATPIATALIPASAAVGMYPIVEGRFRSVTIFAGTCLAGAAGFGGWGIEGNRRRRVDQMVLYLSA